MNSPLQTTALFHMGPVAITEPVIVTWAIMAFLTLFAIAVTRRLSLMPSKAQTISRPTSSPCLRWSTSAPHLPRDGKNLPPPPTESEQRHG